MRAVMPRLDRGIQYAAAPPYPIAVSGILDCPPSRAMTLNKWRRSARFVHALAKTLDQAERAGGPAFAVAGDQLADAPLDRIDQLGGLGTQLQHQIIEPLEPGHLHQLVARHVEHEGGAAAPEQLCEHDGEDRAGPIFVREQP